MAATTKMKNDILNKFFRGDTLEIPSVMYIALSKTAPNDAGGNATEPTAASYARLAVQSSSVNWTEALSGSLSNSVALRFDEAQESWTTAAAPITHWAIYDAQTGGNMLFYGSLVRSQEIPTGSILEIPENGLVTTILNA
jgi:hypothetical protein